jgi:hypothetical protein
MQDEFYKENLKEALKNLIRVNESIYSSLIDISMQGDLKDWNDAVPVGEVHNFDFELFRNSDDTNIQLLVKIIEYVDVTFHTIKNINSIEFDEENGR